MATEGIGCGRTVGDWGIRETEWLEAVANRGVADVSEKEGIREGEVKGRPVGGTSEPEGATGGEATGGGEETSGVGGGTAAGLGEINVEEDEGAAWAAAAALTI
eukprot:TRINITY_DN7225_c0_g1_i1.p2 TRINITY_DN7225_c0_g1~~TRINITY_DN7225_c0_g1_i1.p2  ORF type:complete len:104 (+),score=19.84 TRINITY_DN7225_c0_g1_i1:219-530(+)